MEVKQQQENVYKYYKNFIEDRDAVEGERSSSGRLFTSNINSKIIRGVVDMNGISAKAVVINFKLFSRIYSHRGPIIFSTIRRVELSLKFKQNKKYLSR